MLSTHCRNESADFGARKKIFGSQKGVYPMTRKNRIISSIGLGLFLVSALAASAPAALAADQPVKPPAPSKSTTFLP